MRKWPWLVGSGFLLGLALLWMYLNGLSDGNQKVDQALSQLQQLSSACRQYRIHPKSDGKYPAKLADLVLPPEGRAVVVDGGPSAIVDPWGKPYCYAVGETEAGPVAYGWCAREENGTMRGFGSRLLPDGRVRRFTITDD